MVKVAVVSICWSTPQVPIRAGPASGCNLEFGIHSSSPTGSQIPEYFSCFPGSALAEKKKQKRGQETNSDTLKWDLSTFLNHHLSNFFNDFMFKSNFFSFKTNPVCFIYTCYDFLYCLMDFFLLKLLFPFTK